MKIKRYRMFNVRTAMIVSDFIKGRNMARSIVGVVSMLALLSGCGGDNNNDTQAPPANSVVSDNPSGAAITVFASGMPDPNHPFFQPRGNGRSCDTCHQAAAGWTIVPDQIQALFERTGGTDPLFRPISGANRPDADVSTVEARRVAYSLLLNKGLIRIKRGIPATAEFTLDAVDDPYGFASAAEISMFRRPLPTANMKFLSTVTWDGRNTALDPASTDCLKFPIVTPPRCFASTATNIAAVSNAVLIAHNEDPTPFTKAETDAINNFSLGIFSTQFRDNAAGFLNQGGAKGGPEALLSQEFYFGINDTIDGDYRTLAPFTNIVMTLFSAWLTPSDPAVDAARAAIARGEVLFNTKPINITGVGGLNDALNAPSISGNCTTCHDAPNLGHHSVPLPINIGVSDASRRTVGPDGQPDMPLYTLKNKVTGDTVQTTDPGRGITTGLWADIGKFKGPTLRSLASRAPYFHNGMAQDIPAVVNFYNDRFGIGLTESEQADLAAFLLSL